MSHPTENPTSRVRSGRLWLALALLGLGPLACATRGVQNSVATAVQPTLEACAATAFRPWKTVDGERREIRVALFAESNTVDGWSHSGTRRLEEVLTAWNRVNLPVRLVVSRHWHDADVRVIVLRQLQEDQGSSNTLASFQAGLTRAQISGDGFMERAFVAIAEASPTGTPYSVPEQMGTLQHEIGHALGLAHSTESGALMSKIMTVNGLTHADTRFAKSVYEGPRCGPPAAAVASSTQAGPQRGMY